MNRCPKCKQRVLNLNDCGESGLYKSRHLLCVPCWHRESEEIDRLGTNDLPLVLKAYGPENDYSEDWA